MSPERLPTLILWMMALAVVGALLWILGDLLWHGLPQISWRFISEAPVDSGRSGGIFPILVSTLWILALSLGLALPLGLATATLLAEFGQQFPRFRATVELSLDILAGVPSIVFGLFGNAVFTQVLGLGLSLLSGALTLACMVLPIFIRAVQQSLQAIPQRDRRAAAALGLSRWSTFRTLLFPAAMPGIAVGSLLGFGRAIAETAALIFTSGYVDRLPTSIWDSGRSLSIHIYDLAMNVAGGEPNAYGTACILIGILLFTNSLVAGLSHWFQRYSLRSR
ncbi:phosphate ABC transporter permease PstA [Lyngbya confervoides]|uniref:Phosphate transport system permease protein PstA n=1 Tax=Lyngbya confervoides BDU141951 TaxID=1574623 RepID=A0ABD4T4I1_9CYAN|nr:phosphate ABC transporter permease PstA [Lyngbya confervoides]MCM1983338.1 phosphate ABC transporter permease PstA [Lyngbya confervoides BDU141951]